MSINRAILIGRLTANPELRTTMSGVSVCTFNVAVDRRFGGKEGERQADFINCVAWRQQAEFVSSYFGKGKWIGVEGSIQTRNYEDKHGNKRTAVEVVADNVSFVGDKGDGTKPGAPSVRIDAGPPPATPQAGYQSGSFDDFQEITSDEDLPF